MLVQLLVIRTQHDWLPFRFFGIGYFGSFLVEHGRKTEERFGCPFICLQMRAVHFEAIHFLSIDSCIVALMKPMLRNVTPSEIFG